MMFPFRLRSASSLVFLSAVLLAAPAGAAAPPPPPEKAAPAKKSPPPGLTGNTVPKCEAGTYAAGGFCRPSPPDHYVPSGALYPIACPKGAKAPAGARSPTACVDPNKKDGKK